MVRFVTLGICLLLLCRMAGATSPALTVYADDAYSPYSYQVGNEIKGIYIDLFNEVLKQIPDTNINIKATPWKRGLKLLETGEAFALIPPYYRPKERPYIGAYSIPILAEETVVACRIEVFNQSNRPNWPYDYVGLTIAKNLGYATIDPLFDTPHNPFDITIETGQGNRANLLKLIKGRVPCYINDRFAISFGLRQLQEEKIYDITRDGVIKFGATIKREWSFIAYSKTALEKHPEYLDMISRIDAMLKEMQSNGRLNDIVQKYLLHP